MCDPKRKTSIFYGLYIATEVEHFLFLRDNALSAPSLQEFAWHMYIITCHPILMIQKYVLVLFFPHIFVLLARDVIVTVNLCHTGYSPLVKILIRLLCPKNLDHSREIEIQIVQGLGFLWNGLVEWANRGKMIWIEWSKFSDPSVLNTDIRREAQFALHFMTPR